LLSVTVGDSNPDKSEKLFSSPKRPDQLWGSPSVLFSGYRGSFPWVKRLGDAINHSDPPSTEVKNEWSCTSSPPICLRGVKRENLTILLNEGQLGHTLDTKYAYAVLMK
jgi:hypothetical protein